ncbi:hypothetical protein [Arsukibacterium ikkense]|nr:hypothetical protein [Arsukibacterium ikkense]
MTTSVLVTALSVIVMGQAYANNSTTSISKAANVQLFKEHDALLQRNFNGSSVQFSLIAPRLEFDLAAGAAYAEGQLADLKYESAELAVRYSFINQDKLQLFAETRFNHTNYAGALQHSYNQYGAGFFGRNYWGEKLQVGVRLGYMGASSAAPEQQKGVYTEASLNYPLSNDLEMYLQWSTIGKRERTGLGVRYSF